MEPISIDDFKKVEIRIGEIVSAEPIEGSDKLLKLKVNFGPHSAEASRGEDEIRQVLSGIAKYVQPADLVGKRYPFVTNLAPRMMMGLESQAMILAVSDENLYLFETQAPPGLRVK
jgi:methionine--tRNA ligase beta chain